MSDTKIIIHEQELDQFRTVLDAGNREDILNSCERGAIYVVPDGKRKCVIMLALSVYPGRYTPITSSSTISYTNASYAVSGRAVKEYTGTYQLEVVPKYIMKELAAQDIHDVEFIILETDEVHTRQDKTVTLGGQQYVTLTRDGDEANPTEAEVFIRKMMEYAGEDLASRNLNLHFVEYYLSDSPRRDMPNLLDIIRAESGFVNASSETQYMQNANIYIDIHGGPRATQQLLINLLSILGEEGITINPDNIFTVDGKDAPISQAGESFRINDFVSGIHEFVNYGRMQSLNRFYENSREPISEKGGRLIEVMKDVSSAIQLCDMAWFEDLLPDLADALTAFGSSGEEKRYLGSFLALIVRGYAPLIAWDEADQRYKPCNDALTEIEWCRDKGLYQQMLTICESSVPKYLVDHNVIEYDAYVEYIGNTYKSYYELYNYLFNHSMNAIKNNEDVDLSCTLYSDSNKTYMGYFSLQKKQAGAPNTLREMLSLHFGLKKRRNLSNHGSKAEPSHNDNTNETPIDKLLKNVNRYLELIRQLVELNSDDDYKGTEQIHITVTGLPHQRSDMTSDDIKIIRNSVEALHKYLPSIHKKQDLERMPHLKNSLGEDVNLHPEFKHLYNMLYEAAKYDNVTEREQIVERYCKTNHCNYQLLQDLFRYSNIGPSGELPPLPSLWECLKDRKKKKKSTFWQAAGNRMTNLPIKDPVYLSTHIGKPYHN